jgi:hypothetical protein
MKEQLKGYLTKYLPEFTQDVPLNLPPLKKINLNKLKKEDAKG